MEGSVSLVGGLEGGGMKRRRDAEDLWRVS